MTMEGMGMDLRMAAESDANRDNGAAEPMLDIQRDRLRAERAVRLARLRRAAVPGAEASPPAVVPMADAGDALEAFLGALSRALEPPAPPARPGVPAAILRFARVGAGAAREAEPAPDPGLPGVGPGLLAALDRAGIHCRADLAALEPEELATRLGPIGRLVPASAWIAAARAAASPAPDPA